MVENVNILFVEVGAKIPTYNIEEGGIHSFGRNLILPYPHQPDAAAA